jgi:hypothetical protein
MTEQNKELNKIEPKITEEEVEREWGRWAISHFVDVLNKDVPLEEMIENIKSFRKTEQCFCKSYYDDNGDLQDCTCGKCDVVKPTHTDKEGNGNK